MKLNFQDFDHFDYFSRHTKFNMKGERTKKTLWGSAIFFLFAAVIFYSFLQSTFGFLYTDKPKMSVIQQNLKEKPDIKLNVDFGFFIILLQGGITFVPYDLLPLYFDLHVDYIIEKVIKDKNNKPIRIDSNVTRMTTWEWIDTRGFRSNFQKGLFKKEHILMAADHWHTFSAYSEQNSSFKLSGGPSDDTRTKLRISLKPCIHNNLCKTPIELRNVQLVLGFIENGVTVEKNGSRIDNYLNLEYRYYSDMKNKKFISFFMGIIDLTVSSGLLLDSTETTRGYNILRSTVDTANRTSETDDLLVIDFLPDNQGTIVTVTNKNLFQLLSNIGGLLEILLLVIHFIYNWFNQVVRKVDSIKEINKDLSDYEKILKRLYSINEEEKIKYKKKKDRDRGRVSSLWKQKLSDGLFRSYNSHNLRGIKQSRNTQDYLKKIINTRNNSVSTFHIKDVDSYVTDINLFTLLYANMSKYGWISHIKNNESHRINYLYRWSKFMSESCDVYNFLLNLSETKVLQGFFFKEYHSKIALKINIINTAIENEEAIQLESHLEMDINTGQKETKFKSDETMEGGPTKNKKWSSDENIENLGDLPSKIINLENINKNKKYKKSKKLLLKENSNSQNNKNIFIGRIARHNKHFSNNYFKEMMIWKHYKAATRLLEEKEWKKSIIEGDQNCEYKNDRLRFRLQSNAIVNQTKVYPRLFSNFNFWRSSYLKQKNQRICTLTDGNRGNNDAGSAWIVQEYKIKLLWILNWKIGNFDFLFGKFSED